MPLFLREIKPINVGQKQSTRTVHDNTILECSAEETAKIITLSNLIQQLASLGQHAADIFERLETEVNNINDHAKILKTRVDTVENHINVSICTLLVRTVPFHNFMLFVVLSLFAVDYPNAGRKYSACIGGTGSEKREDNK